MKETLDYNFSSIVMTVFGIILLIAVPFIPFANILTLITIGIVWLLIILSVLILAPITISADDNGLIVNSLLKKHSLKIAEIQTVQKYPAVSNEMSLIFSYGFFGFWGWRREEFIGRYFSYYGTPDNTFLVIMRDGRRYRIGCHNAADIRDYLQNRLRNTEP